MIRVVIADDHAVLRDGLRLVLEAEVDMQVAGLAAHGREAVQLAASLQPEVVVMDISMPELNGLEATRQICAAAPACRVVILSMHAQAEHVRRAFHAGARGYVLKESASREVIEAVRAVHRGERFLSHKISEDVLTDALAATAPPTDPLAQLSVREREVLQLVAEGHTSAAIAARLHLSPKTVETYRSRLMAKLGLSDVPALVKFALKHGLIALE